MKRRSLLTFTLGVVCAGAGCLWAQAKPDFSGTWKLDPLRSRFDKFDKPEIPKSCEFQVEHQEPKLHIVRNTVTEHGETKDVLDLTTDGTEHQATIDGQPATVRAYWDGTHLLVESTRTTPQGPVTVTRRLRIGDKHKILTTVLTMKDQSGQKTAYEFYVKE